MNGTAVKDLPIEYNFQETFINFYWLFTNRTIGMTFSIGINRSIRTNGPLELPFTQPDYMRK